MHQGVFAVLAGSAFRSNGFFVLLRNICLYVRPIEQFRLFSSQFYFFVYFCHSIFLIPVYLSRRTIRESSEDAQDIKYKSSLFNFIPLHGCWKAYALAGLLDYAAMLCSVIALKYTTLTSFTILRSLATPAAMIFSKCFLRRKYRLRHSIGVLICIIGAILNVIQDRIKFDDNNNTKKSEMKYKFFGDLMVVASSLIYGLLNVFCEYAFGEYDGGLHEFLGTTSFFAAFFAFGPAIVWEMDQITSISSTAAVYLSSCVFVGAAGYYLTSRFLEYSESALLNLSVLTENVWAILFSVVLQNIRPNSLFYVGLVLIVSGVVVYESSPSPIVMPIEAETYASEKQESEETTDSTNKNESIVISMFSTNTSSSSAESNGDEAISKC